MAELKSPMQEMGKVPGLTGDGAKTTDHCPAPFDKPRSGGGIPIVTYENPPHGPVPEPSVSGKGDLRLKK